MKRYFGVAVLILLPLVAAADIYKFVDQRGRVYLTDKPNHAGYKRLVKTWKGWTESTISYRDLERNRKRFGPTIELAAKNHQLPMALLHAVITAESAYNPDAISRAGAVGLMQLMPATAERYGVRDRHDPAANVAGGTRYLKDLLGMFNNDVTLALAAYNAGENTVIASGRQIPNIEETQTYVRRVLKYYNDYKKMM
ncbi:MAG: lytic transglycosylase domain-containing protein [Gammaproteobacteria bacterium]|nr:lytic transglycosylase domain-containing protein [Gammaproteobacteria bacterium]MBI5616992.1 lytic transglycosylase domain-containing protein [Gammaproteobacteria bacterium]